MGRNQNIIVAIVTTKQDHIKSGGAPVFVTKNTEGLQKISKTLESILDASAHEIDVETMIIVAH